MLGDYAADPGRLWQDVHHDRNGHFNFALDLALSLRNFDLPEFLLHLERARVWPPVHGLALASVLTFGGIDIRLAIVPSLIGWTATIADISDRPAPTPRSPHRQRRRSTCSDIC